MVLLWFKAKALHDLLPTPEMKKHLEESCQQAGVSYPLKSPRLVVHKSAHQLDLFEGGKPVKSYRLALGKNSKGAKAEQDDGKTPEGEYYICEKISHATFHRFVGISYPNKQDVAQGFRKGLLLAREQADLLEDNQFQRRPNPHTKLGGNCGLHGGGSQSDWTAGNLALEDRDIDEIFFFVRLKDPILIIP
jgi:murein L,D-transpeptidase YafK